MKVFALYKPEHIGLIGPWMRSWEDRGFHARLVSPLEGKPSLKASVARQGGGLYTTLLTFNRSLRPGDARAPKGAARRVTKSMGGLKVFPPGTTREEVARDGFI